MRTIGADSIDRIFEISFFARLHSSKNPFERDIHRIVSVTKHKHKIFGISLSVDSFVMGKWMFAIIWLLVNRKVSSVLDSSGKNISIKLFPLPLAITDDS